MLEGSLPAGLGIWYGWGVVDDSATLYSRPAVSSQSMETWNVFAISTSETVLHNQDTNGGWTGWQDLGFPTANKIT